MTLAPRRILIVLALAFVALATAACTQPAQPAETGTTPTATAPVATDTVEPTSTPVEVPAASAGPITTPASGSALRAAILKAASTGLGLSGNVTVYQLFSQDSAAVGDILPAGGTRTFFAVTGGPNAFEISWSAPFGSKLATIAGLQSAAPLVSPELAAKIDWTKKVAKVTAAPTLASFKAYALKSAKSMAGATYTGTFSVTAKIAKDSTGAWWGNAMAAPSADGLESIGVWGRYQSGKWTGEIADFSTENAMASFFAPDVIVALNLP